MAISNDLFMAILAMDSYNRGYNAGIKDPNAGADQGLLGTSIGNATIGSNSSVLGTNVAKNASFYAQSYTLDGKTIIAYRGTDQASPSWQNHTLGDVVKGWTGARLNVSHEQPYSISGCTPSFHRVPGI